ncbi:hypothetical protein J2T14_004692 [Paenibacillus harenae]|nr:hypothetical protein [Paenibacillus harenae]
MKQAERLSGIGKDDEQRFYHTIRQKHFPGAVVTVSHDRFFIDKIGTKMLSFDPIFGITEQNL